MKYTVVFMETFPRGGCIPHYTHIECEPKDLKTTIENNNLIKSFGGFGCVAFIFNDWVEEEYENVDITKYK